MPSTLVLYAATSVLYISIAELAMGLRIWCSSHDTQRRRKHLPGIAMATVIGAAILASAAGSVNAYIVGGIAAWAIPILFYDTAELDDVRQVGTAVMTIGCFFMVTVMWRDPVTSGEVFRMATLASIFGTLVVCAVASYSEVVGTYSAVDAIVITFFTLIGLGAANILAYVLPADLVPIGSPEILFEYMVGAASLLVGLMVVLGVAVMVGFALTLSTAEEHDELYC